MSETTTAYGPFSMRASASCPPTAVSSVNSRPKVRRYPSSTLGSSSTRRIFSAMSLSQISLLPQSLSSVLHRSRIHTRGQSHEERCAFPNFRLEPDLAPMFFDNDRVGERKPLPCSLSHLLRGEERIENLALNRRRNSASRILHRDFDELPSIACAHRNPPLLPFLHLVL